MDLLTRLREWGRREARNSAATPTLPTALFGTTADLIQRPGVREVQLPN